MKILIATDGTKYCDSAIKAIKVFKLNESDQIKIISVVDIALPMAVDMYAGYLASTTEIEKGLRENAEKVVETSVQKVREKIANEKIFVTGEVLNGSPDSRIVETAEEFGADLIIVGSHGYNSWERLLLGSVSDSVVHHAPCSVLVIRSQD